MSSINENTKNQEENNSKEKNNEKGKVKISKKWLAILLSGVVAASSSAAYVIARTSEKNKIFHEENTIGYEDINTLFNFDVKPEDFVILNVGDHDTVSTWRQSDKINKCINEDISIGLTINSDARNELDIYNDVEYVKGLVKKYKIDYPIYLDIDNIISDNSLNIENKKKIILSFLEKCSSNGMYVGVKGTDTNLCRLKKYCGIDGYDAFLIMDKETIEYDGVANVIKDREGIIRSKENLSEIIKGRKLNSDDGFVGDLAYKVKEGEDILDISLKYGMSVKDLLIFNGLNEKDIKPGTIIRIPSVIDNETSKVSGEKYTYQELDTPIRGCDMSYAQGNRSDWKKLKKNFDFIILRSNFGVEEDSNFQQNTINCSKYDIPIGIYCYNNYSYDDCGDDMELFRKKQNAQVEKTLELLKNKKIDYPVYLDIEDEKGVCSEVFPKEYVKEMLKIWAEKISEAGYIPGIYSNSSGYKYLQSCVDYNISDVFDVWLAGGDQYYADKRDIDINDVVPSENLKEDWVKVSQSTDSCINAGSGNHEGHLDIDYSKIDYAHPKKVEVTNDKRKNPQFEIKEFERTNMDATLLQSGIVLSIAGVVGGGIINNYKKKKEKSKVKRKNSK